MNSFPLISIRLIAFCFVLFGSFMFFREAVSHPVAMAHVRVIGPGQEPLSAFTSSDAIRMVWRGLPALVGAILLLFSVSAARRISPPEQSSVVFIAIVSVRLLLLITLSFVVCDFLDSCFNYLEMMVRYRHEPNELSRSLIWAASTSLMPLVPLAAFWFASPAIGRRIALDANTRNA
jgi:hypothetical protein